MALVTLCSHPLAVRGLAQDELGSLLARLSERPLNRAVLWQIEARPPDPKTIPALRAAFEKREIKQEKQWIAIALLRLGEKSDTYFDFLAGYVREAVEDRAPLCEKFDQQGHPVRAQFSAEFENWCALNHNDPNEVAGKQFGTYPRDILALAEAEDQRASDLFLRGLESPYPGVVAYSIQGLGRLRVLSAIPLISEALNRIPPSERGGVAAQLPWYFGGEAEPLFDRLVPSATLRDNWRSLVQRQRDIEVKRVVNREGHAAPK